MNSVDQIAVVVRDLDEAMRRYFEKLGIGPWSVYTFSPDWVRHMTFRGREQPHSMKLEAIELPRALPDPDRTYPA